LPLRGAFDQVCTQRVTFDLAAGNKELTVILNGKALVSLLIEVPHATGVVLSVISHRVRAADPAHEAAQFHHRSGGVKRGGLLGGVKLTRQFVVIEARSDWLSFGKIFAARRG